MSKDRLNEDRAPTISQEELNLRIQLLDYLFERGHKVSKPLIDAAARFTYDYGQALYAQGKMSQPPTIPTTKGGKL